MRSKYRWQLRVILKKSEVFAPSLSEKTLKVNPDWLGLGHVLTLNQSLWPQGIGVPDELSQAVPTLMAREVFSVTGLEVS